MKFCVVKDSETGNFFGREFEPGYSYSEYTNEDAHIDPCWKPLEFFIGTEGEYNCGITIFESELAAKSYMSNNWKGYSIEVVNLSELDND